MFKGMYAAIPTPFREDGSLHEESLQAICERIIKSGMQGILVCGSTGEYPMLSEEERKYVIKKACQIIGKRTQVIAGCSCHSQKDTIAMVRYAESVGADLALVIPPYYMQTTEEGIYQYYQAVSQACDQIQLLIYNYPDATNVRLSVEMIQRLSRLPKIAGIKNTDGMDHTSKVIEAVKDQENFGVINGFEHMIMGVLCSGGDGAMGIIEALAPEQMMELYRAVRENDLHKAMEINERMRPLYTLMEKEPCPAPVKAAFALLGIDCGEPRRPLLPASEAIREELRKEMEKTGLLA